MESLATLNATALDELAHAPVTTLMGSDGKRYSVPPNLHLLTDDEVIDRGDYIEVKVGLCAGAAVVYNLPEVLPRWNDFGLGLTRYNKVVGYASNKPLRMRGFAAGMNGRITYYIPTADAQRSWSAVSGSRERTGAGISMEVMVPVRLAAVTREDREEFFSSSALRHMPAGFRDGVARLGQNRAALWPSSPSTFHGQCVPYPLVPLVRTYLSELGDAIREYIYDPSSPDLMGTSPIGPIQYLTDMGFGILTRRAIDSWNGSTCRASHELILGTCGHVICQNDAVETRDGPVCRECADEHYVPLEDQDGELVRHSGDDVYEHDNGCYYSYPEDDDDDDDRDDDEAIMDYNTNPLEHVKRDRTITSTPYGDFLMGIELEVDACRCNRSRDSTARECRRDLGTDYVICKYDGSLNSDGFEIVTAPRGMAEHVKRFKAWTPPDWLIAWDAGCCGMHVHIDSHAFTPITLGKFVEFINSTHNDTLINRIAGRHPHWDEQSREYCSRDGMVQQGNPKKTLEGKSVNRYRMVNTTNLGSSEAERLTIPSHGMGSHNTVELRIFRASLNKRRLLAQIEFAHAAVMFCRAASMRELNDKAFLAWLRGFAGVYPHLAKWYGVKANTTEVHVAPEVATCKEI